MKLLGWILLLGATAVAQPLSPPIKLEATSVLGDVVRFGRPFLAQIKVTVNDPSLNQECRLQLQSISNELMSSEVPLRLTLGTRSFTMPLVSGNYNTEASVEGIARSLQSRETISSMTMAPDTDYVALTLTPRKNHFAYLGGYKALLQQGEFRLNYPKSLNLLPETWWVYLGQDAIVVHDLPALKLNDSIEQAVLQWTQSGGTLVLVSNLDPQEYRDTAFESWLPLKPGGLSSGQVPKVIGHSSPQNVVLTHEGYPLVLRRRCGNGWVYQVTTPVTTQEALGNALTSKLWKAIVSDETGLMLRRQVFEGDGRLSILPELPPPATAALAWYLAVYVLVAVPGAYAYLRRKDQVLRLILVIPALSLVFSGGAYYFNTAGRGKELVMRELGLAKLVSGQRVALNDQTSVLFSPAGGQFSIAVPAESLVRPASEYRAQERQHTMLCRGNDYSIENERLAQFGVSRWRGLGVHTLAGSVGLQFKESKQGLSVEIENSSGLTFPQATLIAERNRCSPYFAIEGGRQSQQIQFGSPTRSIEEVLTQSQARLHQDDIYQLVNQIEALRNGRPIVLALSEDPKFSTLSLRGLAPRIIRSTLLMICEDSP